MTMVKEFHHRNFNPCDSMSTSLPGHWNFMSICFLWGHTLSYLNFGAPCSRSSGSYSWAWVSLPFTRFSLLNQLWNLCCPRSSFRSASPPCCPKYSWAGSSPKCIWRVILFFYPASRCGFAAPRFSWTAGQPWLGSGLPVSRSSWPGLEELRALTPTICRLSFPSFPTCA